MNRRTRIATCAVTGALGIAAFVLGMSPALAQSYPGGNAGPGDGAGAETAPDVLGTSVEAGGGLAFTGGQVLLLLALAMLLIAAGVITARLARRRRSLA